MNALAQDQVSNTAKMASRLLGVMGDVGFLLMTAQAFDSDITDETIAEVQSFSDAGITRADYDNIINTLKQLSSAATTVLPSALKMMKIG